MKKIVLEFADISNSTRPSPMDSESEEQSLEANTALAHRVYEATWNDFYTWERDYCRKTLLSLARTHVSGCDLTIGTTSTHGSTGGESFTMVDCHHNTLSILSAETTDVVAPFKPCPPYEVCTPASRNIHVGDDFEDMPFIHMADDPDFDHLLHTADYSRFEWQLPNRDPDCKSRTI
jgi:hypothetical protein